MPIRLSPKTPTGTVVPFRTRSVAPAEGDEAAHEEATAGDVGPFCPQEHQASIEGAGLSGEAWYMVGDWEPRPYWVYTENGKEYARLWWEPGRYGLQSFGFTYWNTEATKKKPPMRPLGITDWAEGCIRDARGRHMRRLAQRRAQDAMRRRGGPKRR